MIKSMTGYGRAQEMIDGMNITVEIKSVNHRYLEFSSKVYRSYSFLEDKLKTYVQSVISRGKVDCFVQIEQLETSDLTIELNQGLAESYYLALKKIAEGFELIDDISVSVMARNQDLFTTRKNAADEEKIWNAVSVVLKKATDAFVEMRMREGAKLKEDVLSRADIIIENVEYIEERSPETVKEYIAKLNARMTEVLSSTQIDEQRILQEAAIYADKIAVAEETVRLRSHIAQLREFMESNEPIGRKLDFLVQEINREANTIGSKAQNVDIAKRVIDMKSEIEKIREQIQNIE